MGANGSRAASFPADGASLCSAVGPQRAPALAASASGAVIAAWEDGRTSPDGVTSNAVFAQQKTFDAVAPAATDMGGNAGCVDHVLLSWFAPGDDGNSGTATAYDLRWSTSPITDANFYLSAGIVTS